ncbi:MULTISPECIES: helix-turn-helix domain-containing protein [unclassified Ruminococcus]|uniref:helix-turn-helix domain-containing protein n=1 Tax=unclassified Ruminococcus TaxID=2608920 RepID=UPI0021092AA6|nr:MULTISPECIES: helix-turn-helix transcriptional regulator [unclassified Ruminococcus]MCQ4023319.1 helix-turn-helix domain-containing protein [Ruminococcus sp. zg-924]MCQ4115686.1 helix-turn-helix domain-containing protein [Ruminococcus sp. zg-921]
MKFSERLKAIREEKGLTQQELSKRSGVSLRTIQNYESGAYRPRFGIVDKLAEALEVSSPELLGQSGMLIADAHEQGGAKAAREVKELVDELVGVFAGGELPQEEREAYMAALTKAYFESSAENKKYTPKKYRK